MPPLTVMFKPASGACNMRCSYCFYADEMRNRAQGVRPIMSIDLLDRAMRSIFASADAQLSFLFQGGEPTLAGLPFFEAFIDCERRYNVKKLPVSHAVQTNACELSEEWIAFFARNHFLVGVSLDGAAVTHNAARQDAFGNPSYARVRGNLDRLRGAGIECNVLCVVNAAVARRPEASFKALARYGFVQFIPCLDPLNAPPRPDALTPEAYLHFLKVTFDLYERAYFAGRPVSVRTFDNWLMLMMGLPPENCGMTGRCAPSMVVESDGEIYPCDFYALDEWRLGNIADVSPAQVVASETMHRFLARSIPVPEQCGVCRWYSLCRNGCVRERDPITGVNRWCNAHRGFFEYAAGRMAQMAQELRAKAMK